MGFSIFVAKIELAVFLEGPRIRAVDKFEQQARFSMPMRSFCYTADLGPQAPDGGSDALPVLRRTSLSARGREG